MAQIEARLQELGITLPTPPAPVASYVPFVIVGNVVHVSGQVSVDAGGGIKGKLGGEIEVEEGQAAARLCGLNLLAQVKAACGGVAPRFPQSSAGLRPVSRKSVAAKSVGAAISTIGSSRSSNWEKGFLNATRQGQRSSARRATYSSTRKTCATCPGNTCAESISTAITR